MNYNRNRPSALGSPWILGVPYKLGPAETTVLNPACNLCDYSFLTIQDTLNMTGKNTEYLQL